jgi:hypothetical protein
MTRRTSKHGTTYTQGSSSTPPAGMPHTCGICGQRIYTSRESFQHHIDDIAHTQHAWHIACKQGGTMNETTEPTTPEPTEPEPDSGDEGDEE